MLMQLITYFASDGDLIDHSETNSSGTHSGTQQKPVEELVNLEPIDVVSNLSKSQHEHVNDLLGEAMLESLDVQKQEGIFF